MMTLLICWHYHDTPDWHINKEAYKADLKALGFDFKSESGDAQVQTNWTANRKKPPISKLFAYAKYQGFSALHFCEIVPSDPTGPTKKYKKPCE